VYFLNLVLLGMGCVEALTAPDGKKFLKYCGAILFCKKIVGVSLFFTRKIKMLRGLVEKIIPRLNLKEIVAQDFLIKKFFF